jgi:putative Holliday junction resolvase
MIPYGGVRALSLDIGQKRIGLAISDSRQSIAQPLKLYTRVSLAKDIEELKKLVQEHEISAIVCGLPKISMVRLVKKRRRS